MKYTPSELKEIWKRVQWQLTHDAALDAVGVKPGMTDYVLRQILHYADEVKKERRRKIKRAV